MKNYPKFLILFSLAALLIGCSSDNLTVIHHPTEAKPGDTLVVELASFFSYASPGGIVMGTVNRQDMNMLVGLPEGWSVISMDYYVAHDWKFANDLLSLADLDNLGDEDMRDLLSEEGQKMYMDSVTVFRTRMQPMNENPTLSQAFRGRRFLAHPSGNDEYQEEIIVNTDQIHSWSGFSAPAEIKFDFFDQTDTSFRIPDEFADNADERLRDTDVGLTIVPIYLFAKIQTGGQTGMHDIFYYSKTDDLPEGDDFTQDPSVDDLSSFDVGSMTYVSVLLDPNVSVSNRIANRHSGSSLKAYPTSFSSSTTIQLPNSHFGGEQVIVRSLDGRLVREIAVGRGEHHVIWDGKDFSGREVRSGTYIVSFTGGGHIVQSCTVRKIR
ncbi:hypothetical protein CHISP_2021 [Chitinispirillum alkaliphilum]|nr:hypothetical protein CHISP_2021 [Chitinispirillum alkaliphilum]